jgi:glycosyltransferase involved in cell wall biosynthesis
MKFLGKKKLQNRTVLLMRTKDRPAFIRRALRSALAQTDQDWGVVILNDGGSLEALHSSLQPFESDLEGRIKIVHFPESLGRGSGLHLNAGIAASQSEFLAIHDDDDTWAPLFLERAREVMGRDAGIVTQSFLIHETFHPEDGFKEVDRNLYEPWQKHGISLFRLAESLTFPPISFLFRRHHCRLVGGFDPELGPLEDWLFALRMFSRFSISFLEEPLAHYHQRMPLGNDALATQANSSERNRKLYGELDCRIRNKLLREDLEQGRQGLGWLVNLAQANGRVHSKLAEAMRNTNSMTDGPHG